MKEIKPCPYCGTTTFEDIFNKRLGGYLINHYCKFGIIKVSIAANDKNEIIDMWNTIIDNYNNRD